MTDAITIAKQRVAEKKALREKEAAERRRVREEKIASGQLDPQDAETLRNALTIRGVVEYYAGRGNHNCSASIQKWRDDHVRGGNLLSPLREDRHPSFSVDETTKRWIDFGGNQSGDVFELIGILEGISDASSKGFPQVLNAARRILGLPEKQFQAQRRQDSNNRQPKEKKEPKKGGGSSNGQAWSEDDWWQTDVGNAERFAQCVEGRVLWCARWKRWMYYDGQKWMWLDESVTKLFVDVVIPSILQESANVPIDQSSQEALEASIKRKEKWLDWAKKSCHTQKIRGALDVAKANSRTLIYDETERFDKQRPIINVSNGTVELNGPLLRPHKLIDYVTKKAEVAYDPYSSCPHWERFVYEVCGGDDEMVDYFQRIIGYSISGECVERKAILWVGRGANGKSTAWEVIREVLGQDYVQTIPIENFIVNERPSISNDIAKLRGSRIAVTSESDDNKAVAEGFLKQITGGETMSSRFMYCEPTEWRPQFVVWWITNYLPRIKGIDEGIWDRILLMPFDVSFVDERDESYQRLTQQGVKVGKIDLNLRSKLVSEREGILKWAVEGYQKWRERNLKVVPQKVIEMKRAYRQEMDQLGAFIKECCDVGSGVGFEVPSNELLSAFQKWSENERFTSVQLAKQMKERNFLKARKVSGVKYLGLRLKELPASATQYDSFDDGNDASHELW